MGTERYLAWIVTRHAEDTFRLSMALLGLFVVIIWESMRLWPEQWRTVGRRVFLIMGEISYASLFTLAVWTLVRAFAGSR
jgi:hypothetical protein